VVTNGSPILSLPMEAGGRKTVDGKIVNSSKESNFSSYIAVGAFHHYLITRDIQFLKKMWDTVSQGIQYAINLAGSGW